MKKTQFKNQQKYSTTLSIFSQLLENELITEAEFVAAEKKLNKKYNPLIPTLSLCTDLI